ncbi:MAG: hypothetical protein ACTHU0_27915 [Kofleriaceae bacterium]
MSEFEDRLSAYLAACRLVDLAEKRASDLREQLTEVCEHPLEHLVATTWSRGYGRYASGKQCKLCRAIRPQGNGVWTAYKQWLGGMASRNQDDASSNWCIDCKYPIAFDSPRYSGPPRERTGLKFKPRPDLDDETVRILDSIDAAAREVSTWPSWKVGRCNCPRADVEWPNEYMGRWVERCTYLIPWPSRHHGQCCDLASGHVGPCRARDR